MINILAEMQAEQIGKIVSHLEYAVHNLKLIQEKIARGEELNQVEQKFLEGYI